MHTSSTPLKVVIVGAPGTGKTSVARRYATGEFSANVQPTLGVDFLHTTLPRRGPRDSPVSLQLWDVAGQDAPGAMSRMFVRHAAGAMVVCDGTAPESFTAAERWIQELAATTAFPGAPAGTAIPMVLMVNKSDLGEACLSPRELDEFAQQHGFATAVRASAKFNDGIGDAFDALVTRMLYLSHVHCTPPPVPVPLMAGAASGRVGLRPPPAPSSSAAARPRGRCGCATGGAGTEGGAVAS